MKREAQAKQTETNQQQQKASTPVLELDVEVLEDRIAPAALGAIRG